MSNRITSPTFTSQDSHTSLALAAAQPTLSISLAPPTVPVPPATPAHTALVPPLPPTLPNPHIFPQSGFTNEVINNEIQRRRIRELGFQLQELQKEAFISGEEIPFPDLTNLPIECFISLGNSQPCLTPMQRFCVPNLIDDADSVYGRIQWSMETNPPLSLDDRQQHANDLNLRYYGAVPQ